MDDQDVKEVVASLYSAADLAVMKSLDTIEDIVFSEAGRTRSSSPEHTNAIQHIVAYGVIAIEYMLASGERMPAYFPPRMVYAKTVTLPILRERIARGWAPPSYAVLAEVLIELAFERAHDEQHDMLRMQQILWLTDKFEHYQINSGWIDSL